MNRPICLWMTSRSRSSLVSKIFANHGVWWGDTLKKSRGYDTYENQVIQKIQKDIINGNYQGIREAMEYCGIDYNERAVESAISR